MGIKIVYLIIYIISISRLLSTVYLHIWCRGDHAFTQLATFRESFSRLICSFVNIRTNIYIDIASDIVLSIVVPQTMSFTLMYNG